MRSEFQKKVWINGSPTGIINCDVDHASNYRPIHEDGPPGVTLQGEPATRANARRRKCCPLSPCSRNGRLPRMMIRATFISPSGGGGRWAMLRAADDAGSSEHGSGGIPYPHTHLIAHYGGCPNTRSMDNKKVHNPRKPAGGDGCNRRAAEQ